MEKKVSVIIPTFGRPVQLNRAVTSVLNQTYKNIEIIVVDDNNEDSNDRKLTEEVMSNLKYESLIYLKHSKNLNGSAARNTGIKGSSGEYLMFLDDDDEFFSRKVEMQLNLLESIGSEYGACYSQYIRKLDGKVIMESAEKREGNLLTEELKRNLFLHAGSNLMVRREVIEELKGFDESFTRNQDVEFVCRLLQKHKIAHCHYLGLIVHMKKTKKNIDFEKITNDFKTKFGDLIKTESLENQKIIKNHHNLQLTRYYIISEKRFIKALKFVVKQRMNPFLICKYFFHLLNRKLRKKAYGFNY
ncbi:glycosyltransferase [Planococcus sp. A6]|uniref:glycosyltransferase family 2 protein n=1 Tax=Planococcus sp. A6 TaxID=2992760 RepID=UPI00237B50E7|nr:glycosyltransferase family 2 protein [Planococcus sp. A6]MDE0582097.1 glycosyltransferase [Planococcus sp. A6]